MSIFRRSTGQNLKRVLRHLPAIIVLMSLLLASGFAAADDGTMFRRNVSKTPDLETEHAALKSLPLYVPAQSSDGTLLTEGIEYYNADGALVETRYEARPLIAHYNDGHVEGIEAEGYGGFPGHGHRDAFAAVSLDDGETWKRTNLSNSADLSSFVIRDGKKSVPYPGDVGRSFIAADGNQVLVIWVSRYASGGSPNYTMSEDERSLVADHLVTEGKITDAAACTDNDLITTPCLYLEDHFSVAGSQGSSDLADEGYPLVGELPYAAVWAARGVLLPPAAEGEASSFVWFKAERLSSAVRDANRPEAVCVKGAGCAVTWQEDPDGMRPGSGDGPGEGWSGAIAHHQTDTWYSYIAWDDFSLVAADTSYGTLYNETGSLTDWVAANDTGSPQAGIPMAIPVRLTDNAMCVAEGDKPYCYVDFDGNGTPDFCADSVHVTIETPEGPTQDVDMCITDDGRLLRGNTASTRARLGLRGYSTLGDYRADSTVYPIDSAWFSTSYEENKGLGDEGEDEVVPEDLIEKVDMGKNVWYHTFDMFNPELVSQGLMLNQPAVYPLDFSNPEGFLTAYGALGYNFYQIDPDPIYMTQANIETTLLQSEIARRPSPISQDWYDAGPSGTVAVQLWKQGVIRRGGPADIMGRRFVIPDEFDPTSDNPYDYGNMVCEDINGNLAWAFTDGTNPRYVKGLCAAPAINLSANTILTSETCGDATGCLDAFPFNDYFDDMDMTDSDPISKIYTWEMSGPGYGETITDPALTSFDDLSWENPYDMAKGHRGFMAGDMVMVMYAWTPNWNDLTNAHSIVNLYNRRSFDGGLSWSTLPGSFTHTDEITYNGDGTTTCEWQGPISEQVPVCTAYAAGEFEQARNVSQLLGSQVTVLDPRYSPTTRSITLDSVSTDSLPDGFLAPLYLDDTRDPSRYFMVYETGETSAYDAGEATPLDLFYSRAINWGDDYLVWQDEPTADCLPAADDDALTGFCNEFDALEGSRLSESGEASVTCSPGGQFFYAAWNQIDFTKTGKEIGSDAWVRRVLFLDDYVPGADEPNGPPHVSINSPADGATFASGAVIDFSGTAADVEDGDLSGTIVWTSSIDGLIGTGPSFSAVLSAGIHTITADVTDSGSLPGSAAVSITVEDPAPANEPPTVSVDSPADGATFASGTAVDFSGAAADLEDGDLSGSIVWTSSIDGAIGTGSGFSAVLSAGTHTITAAVTDSGSLSASAAINITVEDETPTGQLGAAVTTSQAIYVKGDTVQIDVVATDENGGPVEGATVTVLIQFPNIDITKTAVTDASGVAVVTYKINTRKTGTGTTAVTATVTKAGYDDGVGTTSFEVQ